MKRSFVKRLACSIGLLATPLICAPVQAVNVYNVKLPSDVSPTDDAMPEPNNRVDIAGWRWDAKTSQYQVILNVKFYSKDNQFDGQYSMVMLVAYKKPELSQMLVDTLYPTPLSASNQTEVVPKVEANKLVGNRVVASCLDSDGLIYGYKYIWDTDQFGEKSATATPIQFDPAKGKMEYGPKAKGQSSLVELCLPMPDKDNGYNALISNVFATPGRVSSSGTPAYMLFYFGGHVEADLKLNYTLSSRPREMTTAVDYSNNGTRIFYNIGSHDQYAILTKVDTYSCDSDSLHCSTNMANTYTYTCKASDSVSMTLRAQSDHLAINSNGKDIAKLTSTSYPLLSSTPRKNLWIQGEQCQAGYLTGGNCLLSFKGDLVNSVTDIGCVTEDQVLQYVAEKTGQPAVSKRATLGQVKRANGLYLVPARVGDNNGETFQLYVFEFTDSEMQDMLGRAF